MTSAATLVGETKKQKKTTQQYRMPGIEREGIARLSLLETALWPLQCGKLSSNQFVTSYDFSTPAGRTKATVTVRSQLGVKAIDEYVLWGLLGATLSRQDAEPVLMATPYWLLGHLGLATGGTQYAELRESLLRLAVTSYHNTGFYNPETQQREHVAFQFLSTLLPTVGGLGQAIDVNRAWRIEWNTPFFRFCKSTGGTLLFDLDLYRDLSPASRRLLLKLKDRFWREKRVFLNVDDLTINGLGFSANRPMYKRKFDLVNCLRELLEHEVIELGKGQADAKDLFLRRGKGSYVVLLHEGPYFRQLRVARVVGQKNATTDDPLFEPLRRIGVDKAGIRRLLKSYGRGLVQRWIFITEAGMHEKPRGFAGFKASPAAYLIDSVQENRTPPDWFHAHEKRQEQKQWQQEQERIGNVGELPKAYDQERKTALEEFLASDEGRAKYDTALTYYKAFYRATEPDRYLAAAHDATLARIERIDFTFPSFEEWSLTR
jgi:hypothetical protein